MHSKVEQVEVYVSSIREEEGLNKEKEDVLNQGGEETGKEDKVEGTQNPSDESNKMDTMPSMEIQDPTIDEGAKVVKT